MNEMKVLVTLIRERKWENEKWVNNYIMDATADPELLLRRIAQFYLETSSGRQAIVETCNDFNWGDCAKR